MTVHDPDAFSPPEGTASARSADEAGTTTGRVVMDGADIERAVQRIAHEILESNKGARGLVVLGIPRRGVPLAARIARAMGDIEGATVPTGALDITMYRDDLRLRPARGLEPTVIPDGGIDGRVVILVDDVLFSGRTIRSALTALDDIGRPRAVRLAVLVDRGHRELPIRPDYVGRDLPTARAERVLVRLHEHDGVDEVRIHQPQPIPAVASVPMPPRPTTPGGAR